MYVAGKLKCYFALAVLVLMAVLILVSTQFARKKVIYVDDDAAGANDGTSWFNAYVYLQDALADASNSWMPVEISVAQGLYTPDQGAGQTPGDREAAFRLASLISLRGGFAGLRGADPNARDVDAYETILSGDLAGNDGPAKLKEFVACFRGDHVPLKTGGEGFDFDSDNDVDSLDLIAFSQANNRSDNSYHVVTGSGTKETAVLDGFTICGGNASNPSPGNPSESDESLMHSGGMYNYQGSPTVVNCVFTDNSGRSGGGMSNDRSNPMLADCTFRGNCAWDGGGIVNLNKSSPTLMNCTFEGNSGGYGAGIGNQEGSSPILTDCSFIGNSGRSGGGMCNGNDSNPTLVDCVFSNNWAGWGGGGMSNRGSNPTLTDCKFRGNSTEKFGGAMINSEQSSPALTGCMFSQNTSIHHGGGMYNWDSAAIFKNCTFNSNLAGAFGGGIANDDSSPTLTRCVFSKNSTRGVGGAVCSWDNGNSIISNCIFTANLASRGGAIFSASLSGPATDVLTLTLTNCTLCGNRARDGGAVLNGHCSRGELVNCILWGNTADRSGPQVCLDRTGSLTVKYSNLQGGRAGIGIRLTSRVPVWGQGNINVDPLFAIP